MRCNSIFAVPVTKMFLGKFENLPVPAKIVPFFLFLFVSVRSVEAQCPDPEVNKWTGVSVDNTTKQVTAEFWCLDDQYDGDLNLFQVNSYKINNKTMRVVADCNPNSNRWSDPLPLCFPTCHWPRGDYNLRIKLSQKPVGNDRFLMGTEATFSCYDDRVFLLNNVSNAKCNEDGKFNHQPACVATCDGKEILTDELSSKLDVMFNQPISSLKGRYLSGTIASFICKDNNAVLQGAKSTVCKSNGSWMNLVIINQTPNCVSSCPGFPDISSIGLNMTMEIPSNSQTTDRYPIGTAAHFDCSDPHQDLVGNHLLLCHQDDEGKTKWNGHLPYCEATCEPLNLTGKTPILTASYDLPYLLGRSKESLNGRYASNTSVTFSCNNSNNLNGVPFVLNAGSSKVHCHNGKWDTNQLPDCVATCDSRQVLQTNEGQRIKLTFNREETSIFVGYYTSGTKVEFACIDSRSQLRGVSSAVCDQYGSWGTFSQPTCVPTCDGFPSDDVMAVSYYSPSDSTLRPIPHDRYSVNSTAVFRCLDPHQDLVGKTQVKCTQENQWVAKWDENPPRCEKTCDGIPIITNGTFLNEIEYEPPAISGRKKLSLNGRFSVHTTAQFNCDTQKDVKYEMIGDSTSTCEENGEWTVTQQPICVPTCGTESLLTEIEQSFLKVNVFGELSPNMRSRQVRFRESAKANFACKDENAQLVGVRETVCLGDGSWKAFGQLKCIKTCLELYPSTTLEITYNDNDLNNLNGSRYAFGTKATLSCKDQAKQLIGPEELYCSIEGSWNDYSDSQCVSTCGEPLVEKSENSRVELSIKIEASRLVLTKPRGRYSVDTTVMYQCNEDTLHLNGSKILICLPSGEWNGTQPTCLRLDEETESDHSSMSTWIGVCALIVLIALAATFIIYSRRKGKQDIKKREMLAAKKLANESSPEASYKPLALNDGPPEFPRSRGGDVYASS